MISVEQTQVIFILLFVFIIIIIATVALKERFESKLFLNSPKGLTLRILVLLLSIFGIYYVFNFNGEANIIRKAAHTFGFYDARWDQKLLYEVNGYTLGFANNFPGKIMDKPPGYNENEINRIVAEYSLLADITNETRELTSFTDTSIVFILSESFSDPNKINGIDLNMSPVQFVASPDDKAYVGNLIVPSYGGGTPNSEFEILTGLSIQYLLPNMSLPFQDFMSSYKNFPSLVSEFKSGSNNVALTLHSFTDDMYKRPSVYKTLGFDNQMYRDNMIDPEGVDESVYVSDASVYKNILELLKNQDEHLFIHAVTMQNHSPFFKQFDGDEFEMLSLEGTRTEEILNFSQGVAVSDAETKKLIDAISIMDRNVIVVFYGDHIPGLYESQLDHNSIIDVARTPYFVYSNFSKPSYTINGDQSLTYINYLVKDLAGVKVSPFDALVHEFRTNVPAGRFDTYVNNHGDEIEYELFNDVQKKLISDYILIQYDLISGKQYSLKS